MDYSALIVMDLQNAFIEGSALPVPRGAEVVQVLILIKSHWIRNTRSIVVNLKYSS
jgi:hypothetical protein